MRMEPQDIDASLIEINQGEVVNNRVLVVDDDASVLQIYQDSLDNTSFDLADFDFLRMEGERDRDQQVEFDVTVSSQGRDALEQVRNGLEQENPFAVIFLDMRMPPGWDGLETAKRIRQLDDNVYIVFVTAYSDHSVDEIQQLLHKNTLFLTKPFHNDVVLQMARTFCISWAREQCLVVARKRLSQLSRQMAEQVSHDALTQLYNRYYLDRQMEIEIRRARREQQSLGVLMIDIDWFKLYNDQHGHLKGDQALQQIATALQQSIHRPGDFVARYGGEEFCMVLPNTGATGVEVVAEMVRQAVEQLALQFIDASDASFPHLTVSIGGVSRIPHPQDSDASLLEEADQMLYQAKAGGKNRVLIT